MGFFDFLKPKDEGNLVKTISDDDIEIKGNSSGKYLEPYFDNLKIHPTIRKLLWIADGIYQNYDPDVDRKIFENELFRIEFSWDTEPSLLYSKLPIDPKTKIEPEENIGYYPTYEGLNPGQRWTYLNWLRDVSKPINIGYVFIFYYGLERHLVYGNYKEAVDTILLLREHHKNTSFNGYSSNALIMSSILHDDIDTLLRVLKNTDSKSYHGNLLLIAKYLMQLDLSADEIISLSSAVGFRNKGYIKKYPDLFSQKVSSIIESEFGKDKLPFYRLDTTFKPKKDIVFANISFSSETRSPVLPSIVDNDDFKATMHTTLSIAHESLKIDLAEMRKAGIIPKPIETPKNKSDMRKDEGVKPMCPYCKEVLDKAPKRKKKCPHCSNYIFVKPKQNEFPSIYLTEEQVMKLNEIESVNHFKDSLKNKNTTLLRYKRNGVKNVQILSSGGCKACIELHGVVFAIDDALKNMPIPCKECTFQLHNEIPRWCRCTYVAFFDDPEL